MIEVGIGIRNESLVGEEIHGLEVGHNTLLNFSDRPS